MRLGKVSLAPGLKQAVFTGGGLKLAEEWIEAPEEEPSELGDYSGLECRRRSVKSTRGDFLSLVSTIGPDAGSHTEIYERVLQKNRQNF